MGNIVVVPTTVKVIAEKNAKRKSLLVVVMGATAVFIGPHANIAVDQGIRLGATGGSFSTTIADDAEDFVKDVWYGISSVSTNIWVEES